MGRREKPKILSPFQVRWMMNLYPPLLFNRVRVVRLSPDFRSCTVRIAHSVLTRNLQGATFGGTIFSAADPFYPIQYWQIFAHRGERLQAWLRSATIRYLRPAETALTLEFRLSEADVEDAALALAREGRFSKMHAVAAVDSRGETCAAIETEVYLRRPRTGQRETTGF